MVQLQLPNLIIMRLQRGNKLRDKKNQFYKGLMKITSTDDRYIITVVRDLLAKQKNIRMDTLVCIEL